MEYTIDRRVHTRFSLQPGYSRMVVQPLDSPECMWEGHAYDISAGGVRFELDEPLDPGTRIAMRIDLPNTSAARHIGRRSIFAFGRILRVCLDDEEFGRGIGPMRMAAVFTEFAREEDHAMLMEYLAGGRFAVAA
ncbi:MAG: PilZ domain-containing protein [Phycisphaerales bacterium JB043]